MDIYFFEGKYCKVEQKNGFVLYGKVTSVSESGFFLQTDQHSGYFAWSAINHIVEHR